MQNPQRQPMIPGRTASIAALAAALSLAGCAQYANTSPRRRPRRNNSGTIPAMPRRGAKCDLQDGGRFSSKLKFEIGRGFGARSEWVFSARYEMPLTESADDHTLTAGCAYVFP